MFIIFLFSRSRRFDHPLTHVLYTQVSVTDKTDFLKIQLLAPSKRDYVLKKVSILSENDKKVV